MEEDEHELSPLIDFASSAVRSSFLETAETVLGDIRPSLQDLASASATAITGNLAAAFAVHFSMACVKALWESDTTLRQIKAQLGQLIAEPFQTGLEQLRVLDEAKSVTELQRQHKDERYRYVLANFDRAFTLAKPTNQPLLLLLRAIAAMRCQGGGPEASVLFQKFSKAVSTRRATLEARLRIVELQIPKLEQPATQPRRGEADLFAGTRFGAADDWKSGDPGASHLFTGSGLDEIPANWLQGRDLQRRVARARRVAAELRELIQQSHEAERCSDVLAKALGEASADTKSVSR